MAEYRQEDPRAAWFRTLLDPPLRFLLVRHEDATGVSTEQGAKPGEVVAWGIKFPDGITVTRWCVSDVRQTAVFASIQDVVVIHGHGGKTEVKWIDEADG